MRSRHLWNAWFNFCCILPVLITVLSASKSVWRSSKIMTCLVNFVIRIWNFWLWTSIHSPEGVCISFPCSILVVNQTLILFVGALNLFIWHVASVIRWLRFLSNCVPFRHPHFLQFRCLIMFFALRVVFKMESGQKSLRSSLVPHGFVLSYCSTRFLLRVSLSKWLSG